MRIEPSSFGSSGKVGTNPCNAVRQEPLRWNNGESTRIPILPNSSLSKTVLCVWIGMYSGVLRRATLNDCLAARWAKWLERARASVVTCEVRCYFLPGRGTEACRGERRSKPAKRASQPRQMPYIYIHITCTRIAAKRVQLHTEEK